MTVGLAHARNTATVLAYLTLASREQICTCFVISYVDDKTKLAKMNDSCVSKDSACPKVLEINNVLCAM